MSEQSKDEELTPEELAQLDEQPAMGALLKRSLAQPEDIVVEPAKEAELLRGVQRKLRKRSKGKFYGDGWSTAKAPRQTYLITSVVMLLLIGFVFLVLIPWGSGALP